MSAADQTPQDSIPQEAPLTASSPRESDDAPCSEEEYVEYRNELAFGRWLDSQIVEYEAALARQELRRRKATAPSSTLWLKQNPDTDDDPPKSHLNQTVADAAEEKETTKDILRGMKDDLFDETVRARQEELVLERIRMSVAARFTTFPDAYKKEGDETTSKTDDDGSGVTLDHHEQYLRREALRERDELAQCVLRKWKALEEKQLQVEELSAQNREVLRQNQEMWRALRAGSGRKTGTSIPAKSKPNEKHGEKRRRDGRKEEEENDDDQEEEEESIRKENQVLRRVLAKLITGSGIDWYSNKRLRTTMKTLTNDSLWE